MATFNPNPPLGLQWRSSTSFIISTVTISLFSDLFLYGYIVPMVPFLLDNRLHIPQDQIQMYTSWLLAAYAGTALLFSLPAGFLADRLPSRQLPFLCGLFSLLLSTGLLWLGGNIQLLILARALQGMSGAVVWTVGLALVQDTVGSARLGAVFGIIFSFICVGQLAAPVVGGVVYKKAGETVVFMIGFALLGLDFGMRLCVIEKKIAAKYSIPVLEVTSRDDEGESSPLLVKPDDLEQWVIPKDQPGYITRFPLLYCLMDPRLQVAELACFTQAFIIAVFDATLPIEAHDLFAFDSLSVGLLFIPLVLPYLLLGPAAGSAVDKYGTKIPGIMGFALLTLTFIFLRIPHKGGGPEIAKMCIILFMSGLGLALISAPPVVEASFVTEQYYKANKEFFGNEGPYAQLYAVNSMSCSLGATVGPLIAGKLRDTIKYGNMNAVVAGLCAIVGVLIYLFLGRPSSRRLARLSSFRALLFCH